MQPALGNLRAPRPTRCTLSFGRSNTASCGRSRCLAPAAVATDSSAAAHAGLSAGLLKASEEYLLSASIGSSQGGRGLFYRPPPGAEAPAAPEPGKLPPPPPLLLRVPLCVGLPLIVTEADEGEGGGPASFQRELLEEWQAHHGKCLPESLYALLLGTARPPALRLAAWLLWATGHTAPASPPSAAPARPPGAPPPAPPPTLLAPFTDYVAAFLPAPGAEPGCCLRLGPGGAAALPGDARALLRGLQGQVASYAAELRAAGLAEGCDDATLWWAFDMVASRSLSAPVAPGVTTAQLAAFLPWADLANHAPEPSALFAPDLASPAGRALIVLPRRRWGSLAAGEEVTFSYGGELDNAQQLLKYGFCTAGNPNDRLPLSREARAATGRLWRQVLCSVAEEVADRRSAAAAAAGCPGGADAERSRVFAVLASLLEAAAEVREAEEAAPAQAPGAAWPPAGPAAIPGWPSTTPTAEGAAARTALPPLLAWARAAEAGPDPPDSESGSGPSADPASGGAAAAAEGAAPWPVPPGAVLAPGRVLGAALVMLTEERRRLGAAAVALLEAYGEGLGRAGL